MFGTTRRLSFKQRLSRWRARLSIPSLLAGKDERSIISLAAAVNGGVAILVISVLAWLVDLPLLFPALGPSAFIVFSNPFSPAAAPRSVIVGHFVAMAMGIVVWHLVTLVGGRPVSLDGGGWPLLASASVALAATSGLLVWLSCPHAPACATSLIIALGAATAWSHLLGMAVGVVLLSAQAVLMNRMAGVNIPTWSPHPDDGYRG